MGVRSGGRMPRCSISGMLWCTQMPEATMRTVGVRALREQLSQILGDVQAGETVLVTRAGEPVARIEPAKPVVPEDVRRLLASGQATWGGSALRPLDAVTIDPGPDVADILLSQRGERADAVS